MAWTDPISTPQIDRLKRDFAKAQAAMAEVTDPAVIDAITKAITPVQAVLVAIMAGNTEGLTKRHGSDAIDAVSEAVRLAVVLPPAIRALNPTRVIPNKFGKACVSCGRNVPTGEGLAVQASGAWQTWCHPCANETAEAREARIATARAEAEAQRREEEAERAQRYAQAQAERAAQQAKGGETRAFAIDLFDRTGTADKKIPEVRVAIPSATGNNDLDFFRVRWDQRRFNAPRVMRIIGGRGDVPLNAAQAHAALERLVFTDAFAAMLTFGREYGHCGHCGKSLTDEASRAAGIGPVCASRF